MIFEISLFIFLLVGDLLTKQLAASFLSTTGGSYEILKGVWNFIYVENNGAAGGAFAGQTVLLIVITSIVSVALIAMLVFKPKLSKNLRLCLIFIVAGAIGNLVDRIAFGYVRDFIDYTFLQTWFNIDFAIGNIADVYVCVGAVMLIFYVLFEYKDEHFQGLRKFNFKNIKVDKK